MCLISTFLLFVLPMCRNDYRQVEPNKIEYYSSCSDLDCDDDSDETCQESKIEVVIKYVDDYVSFNPDEADYSTYCKDALDYFSIKSQNYLNGQKTSGYSQAYAFRHGPFLYYEYEDSHAFETYEYPYFLSLSKEDYIDYIYINEVDDGDTSIRNTDVGDDYLYSDALNDVGVTDSEYCGNNIKIGSIESGVPNNTLNLSHLN